ncbi:MAG: Mg chelatase-related protein [Frankiales bacterium]|nr:Mg chelatase-related protein [Frankiales bacterium]
MALAHSFSVALVGLDGHVVKVEADLAQGIPGLSITGLPDASLNEARDRIRAAVTNSGQAWPTTKKVTIGLSPASLPKRGSGFDIALAAAVLAADGIVPASELTDVLLLGELGLDGSVRGVAGVLPAVLAGSRQGFTRAVVPMANLAEAQLLPGITAYGVSTLRSLVALLRRVPYDEPAPPTAPVPPPDEHPKDFLEVAGQPVGRTACEVAAAGGHNLLMTGPPGCGKTLLAERVPGILPLLSLDESLEVTAIHSVAEQLPPDAPLVCRPPFQAPHHGATAASIVGGGSGIARPGAASLAHRGVLFLDEAPEFRGGVLDALRQPLESGRISIRRVGGTATYPARFALLLAANPCPCARSESSCTCTPERRRSYLSRLSGPLLDRMDISVGLSAITRQEVMADRGSGDSSADMAARVAHARETALCRLAGTPWRTNGDVPPTILGQRWPIKRAALARAGSFMDEGLLTARGFGRVQRLAWTLADLADRGEPTEVEVDLALSLRLGDLWTRRRAA